MTEQPAVVCRGCGSRAAGREPPPSWREAPSRFEERFWLCQDCSEEYSLAKRQYDTVQRELRQLNRDMGADYKARESELITLGAAALRKIKLITGAWLQAGPRLDPEARA